MSEAGTVIGILAGAVVVLGGLVAVARGLLHLRDTLHDNVTATRENTTALAELRAAVNGRLTRLEDQVAQLMRRRGRA